jgi:Ca2+-transporting ATPase
MTVLIPVSLGWIYPNIFSPVHVIFLEIIMGPTCSIVYENEPIEKNTMLIAPKPFTKTFFQLEGIVYQYFSRTYHIGGNPYDLSICCSTIL